MNLMCVMLLNNSQVVIKKVQMIVAHAICSAIDFPWENTLIQQLISLSSEEQRAQKSRGNLLLRSQLDNQTTALHQHVFTSSAFSRAERCHLVTAHVFTLYLIFSYDFLCDIGQKTLAEVCISGKKSRETMLIAGNMHFT